MPEERDIPKIHRIVAEKIREAREKAKLSTRELAEVLDVSHTYLWAIETGQRRIYLDFLEKLGKYLGVPPADLLKEDTEFETDEIEDRQLAELIKEWEEANRRGDLILLLREFRNLTSEQIHSLVKAVKAIRSTQGKQKTGIAEEGDDINESGKTQ